MKYLVLDIKQATIGRKNEKATVCSLPNLIHKRI